MKIGTKHGVLQKEVVKHVPLAMLYVHAMSLHMHTKDKEINGYYYHELGSPHNVWITMYDCHGCSFKWVYMKVA